MSQTTTTNVALLKINNGTVFDYHNNKMAHVLKIPLGQQTNQQDVKRLKKLSNRRNDYLELRMQYAEQLSEFLCQQDRIKRARERRAMMGLNCPNCAGHEEERIEAAKQRKTKFERMLSDIGQLGTEIREMDEEEHRWEEEQICWQSKVHHVEEQRWQQEAVCWRQKVQLLRENINKENLQQRKEWEEKLHHLRKRVIRWQKDIGSCYEEALNFQEEERRQQEQQDTYRDQVDRRWREVDLHRPNKKANQQLDIQIQAYTQPQTDVHLQTKSDYWHLSGSTEKMSQADMVVLGTKIFQLQQQRFGPGSNPHPYQSSQIDEVKDDETVIRTPPPVNKGNARGKRIGNFAEKLKKVFV